MPRVRTLSAERTFAFRRASGEKFPVRTGRCYSFVCESKLRNACAICGGDFVAGADLCVHVLGDVRDLFGCAHAGGGAQQCLRPRGARSARRRAAALPGKA